MIRTFYQLPLIHYPMMEVKEVKKRFTAFSQWQYLCEFWGRHLLFELLFLKFLLRNSNSKCPLMKCSIFPCLFVHLSMWQCDILQYHLFLPLLSHATSLILQCDLFLPPLRHKTSLMDMVDVDMVDTDMVDTVDIFQKWILYIYKEEAYLCVLHSTGSCTSTLCLSRKRQAVLVGGSLNMFTEKLQPCASWHTLDKDIATIKFICTVICLWKLYRQKWATGRAIEMMYCCTECSFKTHSCIYHIGILRW